MLQDIRQNVQGPMIKVIIWVIVITFAAFGIESILLGGGSSSVAEVNGEEVSPFEVQQLVNTQKRRLINLMGPDLDPALLDDDRLTSQAIESLISRKLLLQSAADMELAISDRELGATVAAMEQFQQGGKFSSDLYKSLLSESGFTPASFKKGLREDLLGMQVRSSLAGAEFTTPAELALYARIADEQRDLRYLTIPLEDFRQGIETSEEQIAGFYASNQQQFLSPETVELDFIELGPDQFREPVEEDRLQQEYELALQDYKYRTQHRVSHILFEDSGGDVASRLAEAQARLAAGESFAEVAKSMSDDIGSSAQGGDLGYTTGDAFPGEMETAIAELELNTVSEPVETEAGTHLLLVTERQEANPPGIDELRMELTERIQLSDARAVLLSTIEQLRDQSFNAPDLDGPAAALGLEVQQSEPITRNQADGLFANDSLLAAAWSDDVLNAGHNSEVIELPNNQFVVLRVRQHNQPEVRPLDEVRDEIDGLLTEQAAREAQAVEAESALAALREGTSVEDYANATGYEWQVELGATRDTETLPPALQRRVFQLPAPEEGNSLYDYAREANGDINVFELDRVTAGELEQLAADARAELRARLINEMGSLVLDEYQRGLRASADISVM